MLKANGNLEKQVQSLEEKYTSATRANGKQEEEVLFLKEKYEAVLERNTRLEQQVAALSTSFLSLKVQQNLPSRPLKWLNLLLYHQSASKLINS